MRMVHDASSDAPTISLRGPGIGPTIVHPAATSPSPVHAQVTTLPKGSEPSLGRGDGPTLLVASTGGHLEQMLRLRERLGASLGPTEWATFPGPQAQSLCQDCVVHLVDYIQPRDVAHAAKDVPTALRIMLSGDYRAVVSTGAGIALPFFLAAAALGVPRYYIESAARADGPSLTGRVAEHLWDTQLFTQYESWANRRWSFVGSLFDAFEPDPLPHLPCAASPSRVVVTLGTMPHYGFRRLVQRLVALLPEVCAPDCEVLWQTGATELGGLRIEGRRQVPSDELQSAVEDADLVVMHGGVGSALMALDAGRCPLMVPRRALFKEHVDDHQRLICDQLDRRAIAVAREAGELSAADLWEAAHSSTRRAAAPPPMVLDRSPRSGRAGRPPGRRRAWDVVGRGNRASSRSELDVHPGRTSIP